MVAQRMGKLPRFMGLSLRNLTLGLVWSAILRQNLADDMVDDNSVFCLHSGAQSKDSLIPKCLKLIRVADPPLFACDAYARRAPIPSLDSHLPRRTREAHDIPDDIII